MADEENPVETAIRLMGSESKLGEATGYSQVAINKAKHRVAAGGKVTGDMAAAIDRATDGRVSKHALREDLFGPQVEPAA